ncbi:hypothetical protein [Demequina mangrovi]|nr:hypothetical protein [Demequina mangrovi]
MRDWTRVAGAATIAAALTACTFAGGGGAASPSPSVEPLVPTVYGSGALALAATGQATIDVAYEVSTLGGAYAEPDEEHDTQAHLYPNAQVALAITNPHETRSIALSTVGSLKIVALDTGLTDAGECAAVLGRAVYGVTGVIGCALAERLVTGAGIARVAGEADSIEPGGTLDVSLALYPVDRTAEETWIDADGAAAAVEAQAGIDAVVIGYGDAHAGLEKDSGLFAAVAAQGGEVATTNDELYAELAEAGSTRATDRVGESLARRYTDEYLTIYEAMRDYALVWVDGGTAIGGCLTSTDEPGFDVAEVECDKDSHHMVEILNAVPLGELIDGEPTLDDADAFSAACDGHRDYMTENLGQRSNYFIVIAAADDENALSGDDTALCVLG